ncbi:SGNH/GDSL hydrolase family protein [Kiritimatiellota bacterium B12222]|nr:SGNH/GDSL hydrolase family protein [Kiritimatiellota bacterium B12222]
MNVDIPPISSAGSDLEIYQNRAALVHSVKALSTGAMTVGFMGGSITDARTKNRWPEAVIAWINDRFPELRVGVENAAIGATGSDLAVFRVERDILQRNCDLVFVEYAVNDWDFDPQLRKKSREGLIRKLLRADTCDVILVYTFRQEMYQEMMSGIVPESIAEFELLASHYNLNSVWMGLYSLEEVKRGLMKWEDWLPDGLHPQQRGSLSYAQSVISFLEIKLKEVSPDSVERAVGSMPLPLRSDHWGETDLLSFDQVKTQGPWHVDRSCQLVWMDQVLTTSAVGASLQFEFTGCGLCLGFDFGKSSSEFTYSLDGGEWKFTHRERPVWCGDEGWFKLFHLADELEDGVHRIEIKVIHGNGDRSQWKGSNFKLAFIGIILCPDIPTSV